MRSRPLQCAVLSHENHRTTFLPAAGPCFTSRPAGEDAEGGLGKEGGGPGESSQSRLAASFVVRSWMWSACRLDVVFFSRVLLKTVFPKVLRYGYRLVDVGFILWQGFLRCVNQDVDIYMKLRVCFLFSRPLLRYRCYLCDA